MGAQFTIRELLNRDPFQPFRVVTTSGKSYTIRDVNLVAVLKSEVFIAKPNSDNRTYVPYLHIASVELLANGDRPTSSRRKRRK